MTDGNRMFTLFATLILVLLLVGLLQRHNRRIHIPLMASAFAGDLALVLAVELSRQAIEKAYQHLDNPLLVFHIGVSVAMLVLYTALTISGVRLSKGDESVRNWHRRLAPAFILCRLANYVTSFWVSDL